MGHTYPGTACIEYGGGACETWCAARWHEGGPSPPHTRLVLGAPWATPRQSLQLDIGNKLM
eukprot:7586841-Pyramimonas_sp.AAC.1